MVHIGDLSENMKVRARDGEELGTIIRIEEAGILVEKGIFLKDYLVPVALVTEVREGDVYLSLTREELREREVVGARPPIAERTLREESAQFVHEGEEVGAERGSRMPDNLREGGGPSPSSER
jgi:hypothetical protein